LVDIFNNPKKIIVNMKRILTPFFALLLVGATGMMTAGAQTGKPTLAVFVVGNMDNALVSPLTTQLGANLTSGGQYALTSVSTSSKLTELQSAYNAGGGSSIDRSVLAEWGRTNGISAICLVVDDVKGNDHMFSAQLIDAKDSKLSGKGHYIRTGVGSGDLPRVSLTLAKQLEGPIHAARREVTPQQKWFEPEMVFVGGGTFMMGCTAEYTAYCTDREKPAHSVTLSSFYMGKYEITQAQWKAVMAGHLLEDAYTWRNDNCGEVPCDDQRPVETISWFDIDTAFLPRLNRQTGKKYRLPTEAEWEYAARGCKGDGNGGTATCENLLYSGSNDPNEAGWHKDHTSTTHPIGQKKPNRLGIYDMFGNVWEWVYDWSSTYTNAAVTNPTGPNQGSTRILRGGAWYDRAVDFGRAIDRNPYEAPYIKNSRIGFRVALPAQ
jgi:formylglycine-generating enzyme required for sulfatase activity